MYEWYNKTTESKRILTFWWCIRTLPFFARLGPIMFLGPTTTWTTSSWCAFTSTDQMRKSNEELDKFLKERPNQKELVDRNILKGTLSSSSSPPLSPLTHLSCPLEFFPAAIFIWFSLRSRPPCFRWQKCKNWGKPMLQWGPRPNDQKGPRVPEARHYEKKGESMRAWERKIGRALTMLLDPGASRQHNEGPRFSYSCSLCGVDFLRVLWPICYCFTWIQLPRPRRPLLNNSLTTNPLYLWYVLNRPQDRPCSATPGRRTQACQVGDSLGPQDREPPYRLRVDWPQHLAW